MNEPVAGKRPFQTGWIKSGLARRLPRLHRAALPLPPHAHPRLPRGRQPGDPHSFRLALLEGKESAHARRLLARKYPFSHGNMVPLAHRLLGYRTMHLELRCPGDASRDLG